MDKTLILQQTSLLVKKDFDLDYIPEDVTEAELLDFLEGFILDLLDKNMERLFYVLYRLDIDEKKVHQALSPLSPGNPQTTLANLIFQREQQKAITRIQYSSNQEEDDEVSAW